MSATRVLLTGAAGQVGYACARSAPTGVELLSLARADLDVSDAGAVNRVVSGFRPDLLINAAAYTAVDQAERERDLARLGNETGPANLAAAMARLGSGRMVHVSTDFVFDGSASVPYTPAARTAPLGAYGETKLAGELAVTAALGPRAIILRTAWVYSATGKSFLRTMLRLMAQGPVRVVADQVGTPTSADSVARAIWSLSAHGAEGVWHWTDAGVASWYDFAVAIAEEGSEKGMLPTGVMVTPIATSDYPTPARRPPYSVLDKSETIRRCGLLPRHWRANLRDVIEEISRG